VDLIWGLTDGWWAFEDEPLRTVSPLIDLDAWGDAFKDAGFELVTSYPQSPAAESPPTTGVVVARKPLASQTQLTVADAAGRNGHLPAMAHRIAGLTRLEQQGADVEVIAADVADQASMRTAVDRALRRFGTIDGVIHAALVLNDGAMQVKTRDAVSAVFAPKVDGTLVLKEVCQGSTSTSSSSSRRSCRSLEVPVRSTTAPRAISRTCSLTPSKWLARSVITINWGAWREMARRSGRRWNEGPPLRRRCPTHVSREGLEAFTAHSRLARPQVLVSPVEPER
jgi:NAD(P)-dependent dehydrogenase (short-subunit alcohol dehydrogenase family)